MSRIFGLRWGSAVSIFCRIPTIYGCLWKAGKLYSSGLFYILERIIFSELSFLWMPKGSWLVNIMKIVTPTLQTSQRKGYFSERNIYGAI